MNKYSHLFQASVNYFSSISFWIMIFNQKPTVFIIVFAGIAYLFIICLFWRDEGTATSSLPPIKTSGSRHIAENDFEENGDSKGILFWTDFYCNKWFIYYSIDLVCSSNFFLSVTSGLLFWLRDFIQGNDDVFTHLDETDNASLRLGPYEFSNKRNLSFCNNRRVSNLKVIYNSVDPSKWQGTLIRIHRKLQFSIYFCAGGGSKSVAIPRSQKYTNTRNWYDVVNGTDPKNCLLPCTQILIYYVDERIW